MSDELNLEPYQVRTDLALEAHEQATEKKRKQKIGSQVDGVIVKEENLEGVKLTTVRITDVGAEQVGKKAGHYLTFEMQGIRKRDSALQETVEKVFARQFAGFMKQQGISKDASCLVVGLGNWNVTPDALGPDRKSVV